MADLGSELEALAYRLRRAGQDDLGRELTAAMRRSVNQVPGKIGAGLAPHLPDQYAAELGADLDIKTVTRNSGSTTADAAVSVYAQTRSGKRRKLRRLDSGLISHPLYGNREHWYTQTGMSEGMKPGWFTGPCQDAEPHVRTELERALRDVAGRAAQ